MYALALDRLDDKAADFLGLKCVFERVKIVERHLYAIRQEALEALAEDLVAVQRQRTVGQAVEGVAAIGDAGPPRRRAAEFDRRLDALGAGIGEERLLQMRHALKQPLREDASQRRHIHLNEIGKFDVEHLAQRVVYGRMIAPDGEHPEAAEQVEIFRARAVPQILPLAAHETRIVADGLEHPHHLLVHKARVQRVAFGFALCEQGFDINAHFDLPRGAAKR